MKFKSFIIAIALIGIFLLTSCGHQVSTIGLGTGFSIGGGEYGSIRYGDGLFGNFITKDGVSFKAELDSTTGFSYDPTSNTYKGIKSIQYEIAPQINGYAVDFAQKNPEVAKLYYDALVKYYENKKDIATSPETKPMISEEKSKQATTSVAETLKKAIDKAKSLINNKEANEGKEATFQCDGNCNYDNLTGNADITYQLSIAMKLLSYDGYSHKMDNTGEYYTTTLEHFITQLAGLQSKGRKETPLRVKYVTVKDGVITRLMFAYVRDDGTIEDVDCPSCIAIPDPE